VHVLAGIQTLLDVSTQFIELAGEGPELECRLERASRIGLLPVYVCVCVCVCVCECVSVCVGEWVSE
jgi:hypothetical protein